MKAEEIRTAEDLIQFLGEEKTKQLFEEYITEIIGKENTETEAPFEY